MATMKRFRAVTVVTAILSVAVAVPAFAVPLDPDATFGNDGKVRAVSYGSTQELSVDGDTYYLGGLYYGAGSGEYTSWVRSIDATGESLAAGGFQAACFGWYPAIRDILVTTNGDILVVGYAYGGEIPGYGFILSFNPDLTVDESWGSDQLSCVGQKGMQLLDSYDLTDLSAAALDSQGRILLAGRVFGDLAVMRLNPDGAIDQTFATDGVLRYRLPNTNEKVTDLVVDSQDRAVIAGQSTGAYSSSRAFVARITEGGALDADWGESGIRYLSTGTSDVRSVHVLTDDRVVVGLTDGWSDVAVVRLLTDGTNDVSFAGTGRVHLECRAPRRESPLSAVTINPRSQGGNRVTAYLVCREDRKTRYLAAAWLDDGSPAPSFGADNRVEMPWPSPVLLAEGLSTGQTMAVMYGPLYRAQVLVRLGR